MKKVVHIISLLKELGGVQQAFISYYKYAQKHSEFKQCIFSNHSISKKYGHFNNFYKISKNFVNFLKHLYSKDSIIYFHNKLSSKKVFYLLKFLPINNIIFHEHGTAWNVKSQNHKEIYKSNAKLAKKIIVNSNATKNFLIKRFKINKNKIKLAYYGFNDSPLKRIVSITSHLSDDALVLRVDGLNFCVDTTSITKMLQITKEKNLDLMKFQDDWPIIFCGDIYRVGALRKMMDDIGGPDSTDARYHIHPKYYLLSDKKYDCARYTPETYSDETLNRHRLSAKTVYEERELGDGKDHAIAAGDALSFHYKLALNYLNNPVKLLDIACGLGYGTAMLADVCGEVVGADIDASVIALASNKYNALNNVKFLTADCESLPFDDNYFDAIVSFETIEHVDVDRYLTEMHRVISEGGSFILSSPQNAIGHIPVNPWHIQEYTLEDLQKMVSKYFVVDKVIGLKQGTIYFDNDPVGTNTVLICHKSN